MQPPKSKIDYLRMKEKKKTHAEKIEEQLKNIMDRNKIIYGRQLKEK